MLIKTEQRFLDNVKFYIKRKKYLRIKADIEPVIEELKSGNLLGDKMSGYNIPEGSAVYKVRVPNSSTGSGKSNGFRILYYAKIGDEIYLLTIYSKKDTERIPGRSQIQNFLDNIISHD